MTDIPKLQTRSVEQPAPRAGAPRPKRKATNRPAGGAAALRQADPDTLDTTPTDTRPLSKLDRIVALLARPEGVSLADLCAATGWQPHSVRGALSGTLKRKGVVISSWKADGIRRYHRETCA